MREDIKHSLWSSGARENATVLLVWWSRKSKASPLPLKLKIKQHFKKKKRSEILCLNFLNTKCRMTAAYIKAHKLEVSNSIVWNSSINQGSNKTVITMHLNTFNFYSFFSVFSHTHLNKMQESQDWAQTRWTMVVAVMTGYCLFQSHTLNAVFLCRQKGEKTTHLAHHARKIFLCMSKSKLTVLKWTHECSIKTRNLQLMTT